MHPEYFVVDNKTKQIINQVGWDGVCDYTLSYGDVTLYPADDSGEVGWFREPDGSYVGCNLQEARRIKIGELTQRRKVATENFVFGGMSIRLDKDTENAIGKAAQSLLRQPAKAAVNWEVSPGLFTTFDLQSMNALGDAAFVHVQQCFTNARRISEAVQAATSVEEVFAIDVNFGWPNG